MNWALVPKGHGLIPALVIATFIILLSIPSDILLLFCVYTYIVQLNGAVGSQLYSIIFTLNKVFYKIQYL